MADDTLTLPLPLLSFDDEPDDVVVPFTPSVAEGVVPLGYDQSTFFYLSRSSRQVHVLTAEQHSHKSLMAMASVPHYWERSRFLSDKGRIQWDDATDWLMSECRAAGIYNPERVRGRGAWFDSGRAVLHLGDRLLVDGRPFPLMLPGSTAIYQAALPLPLPIAAPLPTATAHELVMLAAALRWTKPISGTLFAGWIVCALVCGALKWRPSIWLTGSTGAGKSWALDNLLAPLVGPVALQVLSKTSEAGIRQTLNSDALPVIFDEFEREDNAAATRVQGVLDLMRQASSESEKKIIKGTQNQAMARAFRIRSCFAFSSINIGMTHGADESRVTVLALQPPNGRDAASQEAFSDLAARAVHIITPEFAAGLLARAVGLLPVIRDNAETFAVAIASKMGTRRLGDQLGALLAGAYSLHAARRITPSQAEAFICKQDWGESAGDETTSDEQRLLSHLTAHRIRLAQGNGAAIELTLGRLIEAAFGNDDRIARDVAADELRHWGLRARTEPGPGMGLWVSTSHSAIAKALAGTPWAANWSRSLARLPGAGSPSVTVVRFALGHLSRAVWLPWSLLDRSD